MKNKVWKSLGIVLSALWLLSTGFYAFMVFIVDEGFTQPDLVQNRLLCVLGYSVFGVGPVLGFILLMKRRNEPVGYAALTVLVLFAASPILFFLLAVLP